MIADTPPIGDPPPLYLYYLDRELGDAVGYQLTPTVAEQTTAALLLGTSSLLYAGLSLPLENPGLIGTEGMFVDLVQADALHLLSSHSDIGEFMDSRRVLYQHDRDRYPRYFGSGLGALSGLSPTLVGPVSTTKTLHRHLEDWADGKPHIPGSYELPLEAETALLGRVRTTLARRESEAITFALFHDVGQGMASGSMLVRTVRRQISLEYAAHYLDLVDGRLPTGVAKPFALFDRHLGADDLSHNVRLLAAILKAAGLGDLLALRWSDARPMWNSFLPIRQSTTHQLFVGLIRQLTSALAEQARVQRGDPARPLLLPQLIGRVREVTASQQLPVATPDEMLDRGYSMLAGAIARLEKTSLRPFLKATESRAVPPPADILILTATDVETNAVFAAFGRDARTTDNDFRPRDTSYYNLGTHGGAAVWCLQSETGPLGVDGSMMTTGAAVRELDPSILLMVGIAFGMDPGSQKIGDVLVADRIRGYETIRLGQSPDGDRAIKDRNDRIPVSASVSSALRTAQLSWGGGTVLRGAVFSGLKLVDNAEFLALLRELDPEPIGGEMEAIGVWPVALRNHRDWGLVKAICDWGDGTKSEDKEARQLQAATQAAEFVAHAVKRGLLTRRPS